MLVDMWRLTLMLALATAASSQNVGMIEAAGEARKYWPQFRGPLGGGVAPDDAAPPLEFGPGKNVLWSADSGVGHGSLCIWGNRVFLQSYNAPAKRLETVALDRATGTLLWRQVLAPKEFERVHSISNPATATPASDGERVYVYFGSYGLAAYTVDGKTAWEYPLPTASVPFGSGTSPVVHSGLLLLSYDGQPETVLYALNARNGSLRWKAPLPPAGVPLVASHATPVVWNGQAVVHGGNSVSGVDLRDGSRRWWLSTTTAGTASPIAQAGMLYVPGWSNVGDPSYIPPQPPWPEVLARYDADKDGRLSKQESGRIVLMRRPELRDDTPFAHVTLGGVFAYVDLDKDGYADAKEWEAAMSMVAGMIKPHGLFAVRAGGEGDITGTHVAWRESRNVPEVPSPVLYRDKVYMVTNGGIVTCMDAKDGRAVFRGRLGAPGEYYASPVAANGRLYFTSREGVITVLEAGEELRVLARNELKEDVFASPAIVGDTLYIRTAAHVYAFRASGENK